MMESESKSFLYAALGIGAIGALLAFVGGGPLGLFGGLIAGISCIMGVLIWKYGYLVIPLITQKTNIVMKTDTGYEVPPSNDVVLKSANGVYYASAFLGIRIFESTSEKTP